MNSTKPILLVEDDDVDAASVKRALAEMEDPPDVVHRTCAEDALVYLKDPNNGAPCVILLDLNMPGMSGLDLLRHIKRDTDLRIIPVIVLTTSSDECHVFDSFDLSVAGYIVKPFGHEKCVESMRAISRYWTLSQLPTET